MPTMPTYSKTIYIEVVAADEDSAEGIVSELSDILNDDSRVRDVDLGGPIEEVDDPDDDSLICEKCARPVTVVSIPDGDYLADVETADAVCPEGGRHVNAGFVDAASRLAELAEECPMTSDAPVYDEAKPYLLIEENVRGGEWWLTMFSTPDDAADYHAGQEYPDEWNIDRLVDLRDGSEATGIVTRSVAWKASK